MVVKQIPQDEALKLFLKGTDIMLMSPGTGDSEWREMIPDTLSNLLEGMMFFRREPAMETGLDIKTDRTLSDIPLPAFNPSRAPDSTGIDSDNEPEKEADNSDDPEPEASEYDNEDKEKDAKHKKRVQVDTGKLMALRKAGWSVSKIADELGIGKSTVYNYVMKMQKGAVNENN